MARGMIDEWANDEDKLFLLKSWAREGLTDEDIAKNIGIDVRTLYRWKKKDSHICQSLKKGKEIADYEVENALFKKAVGFTAVDRVVTTRRTVEYEDGKRVKEISEPIVTEVERYFPPDTTAQIFWLKNRKPQYWRDKQEKELYGEGKVQIIDSIRDYS